MHEGTLVNYISHWDAALSSGGSGQVLDCSRVVRGRFGTSIRTVVSAAETVVSAGETAVSAAETVVSAAEAAVSAADTVVSAAEMVVSAAETVVSAAETIVSAAEAGVSAPPIWAGFKNLSEGRHVRVVGFIWK